MCGDKGHSYTGPHLGGHLGLRLLLHRAPPRPGPAGPYTMSDRESVGTGTCGVFQWLSSLKGLAAQEPGRAEVYRYGTPSRNFS
jgi:hypothetical protein